MNFWNLYPFVRLVVALILGIVFHEIFEGFSIYFIGIGLILLVVSISYLSPKFGFYKLRHLNALLTFLVVTALGAWLTHQKYHNHPANHYTNITGKIIGFSGNIISSVNERPKYFRYDLELKAVKTKDSTSTATGKIHLYIIKKDSLVKPFEYGDELLVFGGIYSVPKPDNPNEFDYRKYLSLQNIHAHSFVKPQNVQLDGNFPKNTLLKYAFLARNWCKQKINQFISDEREKSVANALLLGVKDHLEKETKLAYSTAGAMHVLAVSGLHVGIIFLILKSVLGFLRKKGKYGQLVFTIITVTVIWFYAMMTGLSPSVLRAATMFSFIAIGEQMGNRGNIYNTLAIAAFVLLLFDPHLIYSVGFQLSFAAVLGIVYLQPKFYRLFDLEKYKLLDKTWAITCVSIAAQIATFPLTAYYFHQFPTYFLISNLVVIPAAFAVLVGGIAMLLGSAVHSVVGQMIGFLLNLLLWSLNELILWFSSWSNSLIEWIYLDKVGLLLVIAIILVLFAGLQHRKFPLLVMSVGLFLGLVGWNIYAHLEQNKRNELILYEISDKIAVDYIKGHTSKLYIDNYDSSELDLLGFQINPHRLASRLNPIEYDISNLPMQKLYAGGAVSCGMVGGKKILQIDSTTFHLNFLSDLEIDILYINNRSVKNLNWLLKKVKTDDVILGKGNNWYYSDKIKKQGIKSGVNVHSLKEDGCFLKSL